MFLAFPVAVLFVVVSELFVEVFVAVVVIVLSLRVEAVVVVVVDLSVEFVVLAESDGRPEK